MKTKTKKPPIQFVVAGNNLVLHDGVVYYQHLDDFTAALENGEDADGYTIKDYARCTVADAKKILELFIQLNEATEKLRKVTEDADKKLDGMEAFGNTPSIEEGGIISIGCTDIDLYEAQAALKVLNRK
jgi:hypothetical protein